MAAARLFTPIELNIDNSWPLFKIEKDGKVSYILGTVHLLPLKALPESFLTIIDQANYLVAETTLSDKLSHEDLRSIGFITEIPDEKCITNLSEEEKQQFSEKAKKFFNERTNIDFPDLKFINPDFAYWIALLANRPKACMDFQLQEKFGKNTFAIEGNERYKFLRSSSIKDLKKYLKKSENSFMKTEAKSEFSFLNNRIATIDSELYFENIVKRHLPWISKIIHQHSTSGGTGLFAFGASHLSGFANVLELLSACGFRISRVNNSGISSDFNCPLRYNNDPELLAQIKSYLGDQFTERLVFS